MKNVLSYLINKYKLDVIDKRIVEIPNVERKFLANWIHDLDMRTGVEVGVAAGEYSEVLCKANSQMELIGIDPWVPYMDYLDYVKKSTFVRLEKEARERLDSFSNYKFIKKSSMDAVKMFEDESQDFVYIDANHQEPYISQDIREWSKKVKSGGIVSGHDFVRGERVDVRGAVLDYTKRHNIKPVFVLGANEKKSGTIRERNRSWLFIKP